LVRWKRKDCGRVPKGRGGRVGIRTVSPPLRHLGTQGRLEPTRYFSGILPFAWPCGWVGTQILKHLPILLPTLGNTGQYLFDNRRIPLNIDPPAPDGKANSLLAIPLGSADKHLTRRVDPVN
jgi:hypothetical protein